VENARRADRKPKLIEAIRKAFGMRYLYIAGPMIVLSCFKFVFFLFFIECSIFC